MVRNLPTLHQPSLIQRHQGHREGVKNLSEQFRPVRQERNLLEGLHPVVMDRLFVSHRSEAIRRMGCRLEDQPWDNLQGAQWCSNDLLLCGSHLGVLHRKVSLRCDNHPCAILQGEAREVPRAFRQGHHKDTVASLLIRAYPRTQESLRNVPNQQDRQAVPFHREECTACRR